MRGLNYKTRFIDLAGELNTEMPLFWVRKVADALNEPGQGGRGARKVLVLGVAYKKDIDDIRESPALDIIRLLEQQGADGELSRSRTCPRSPRTAHELALGAAHRRDAARRPTASMIVTDHTSLDYGLIRREAQAGGRHAERARARKA